MNELLLTNGLALISLTGIIGVKIWQQNCDRARPIYIAAPPPRVYAAIKKVLAGYYLGELHYRIVTADPTTLTIRAVMEWRDRVEKELWFLHPQGYKLNQIVLDVSVSLDRETNMTKVQLRWIVLDPLFRGRTWLVQRTTDQMIGAELSAISLTQGQKQV